jgi:large subunit ribosomal protein L29
MVVSKVKLSEMRERTIDELNQEVISNRKKLFELRMSLSLQKLENPSEIAKTRDQIAQLKTVIREKQIQK